MLLNLHVKNIALIDEADVNLSEGLNILTGETGAGKSILIDSIGFLLGERAGRELVRSGETSATVQALFSDLDEGTTTRLAAVGVPADENGELLLERSMNAVGKSSARANGRPVSLALLRAAGMLLVNIHGQSDTHALTDSACHLAILDRYAGNAALLAEYRDRYAKAGVELSAEEAMDEIAAASGLPVPELFAAVTELELAGRIRQHSGRRYSL